MSKLFILTNPLKQAPWQKDYECIFFKALADNNIDFSSNFRQSEITESDALWVMHHSDLSESWVKNGKFKVISQAHGTAVNPYCYQVNKKNEAYLYSNVVDYVLVFHPRMGEAIKKVYPKVETIPIGFPVEVPSRFKNKNKKKKIVVSGRITPDKNFLLNTYLLKEFLAEYEIVFCIPDTLTQRRVFVEFYGGIDRFTDLGYKLKFLDREESLEELSTAEFYFTSSLGDTGSVTLAEAQLCGCYCIVPDFTKDSIPAYSYVIDKTYTPWSLIEITNMINNKRPYNFNMAYYDPQIVTSKFIHFLKTIFK